MDSDHYGTVTGKTFRLSICLKRFFSDERARCYITADKGLQFRWLVARLRRLFELRGPLCLVTRGHLLPPDEPLALLSHDDLVEVIPKLYKIFPDNLESDTSDGSEILDLFGDPDNKKQKNTDPVKILGKEDNLNVKTSNGAVECRAKDTDIPEQTPTSTQGLQNEESKNNDNIDDEKLKENTENEMLEELKRKALEMLDQCSMPPKRKRKRVRRRKPCSTIQESGNNTADSEDVTDGLERLQQSITQTATACVDIPEGTSSPQRSDAIILRNNKEYTRVARLVRSLS